MKRCLKLSYSIRSQKKGWYNFFNKKLLPVLIILLKGCYTKSLKYRVDVPSALGSQTVFFLILFQRGAFEFYNLLINVYFMLAFCVLLN